MDLPNAASREQILSFYLQDKPGIEKLAKKGLISMLSILVRTSTWSNIYTVYTH